MKLVNWNSEVARIFYKNTEWPKVRIVAYLQCEHCGERQKAAGGTHDISSFRRVQDDALKKVIKKIAKAFANTHRGCEKCGSVSILDRDSREILTGQAQRDVTREFLGGELQKIREKFAT